MKKILTLFLYALLFVITLSGCGKNKNSETGSDTLNTQMENRDYGYLFRDLPEEKYITPALEFAGGDGTKDNPYQISNAAQLALLHEKMIGEDKEYARAYYVLTADIVINDVSDFESWENTAPEYSWIPIGFEANEFDGVFDGKGYTISGLYINTNCSISDSGSTNNYGLFDTVNGTIKNIKIEQSYIAVSGAKCNVGSIAGQLNDEAVIDNCSSTAVLNCYTNSLGGIAGYIQGGVHLIIGSNAKEKELRYTTISNCTFAGKITQIQDEVLSDIGGISGRSDGNIHNCVNIGTIKFASNNVDCVGGIVGRMGDGTLSNCRNEGELQCETEDDKAIGVGGIVGKAYISNIGGKDYMSRGVRIIRCENSGMVVGSKYAGGIIGVVTNDHSDYCATISDCFNYGIVSSQNYTAGIIGEIFCNGEAEKGYSIEVENCENTADLNKGTVGGIVNTFICVNGNVKIAGCKNSGMLASEGQHCAGIISYWQMQGNPSSCNIMIDNCENTGSIESSLNAGGIISFMSSFLSEKEVKNDVSITISNCVNNGNITVDSVNCYMGGILANWGMADIVTTIDTCTNNGTFLINATLDNTVYEEEDKVFTLSQIIGGIVGRVGSGIFLTTDVDKADDRNVQASKADLKITNSNNTGKCKVVNINKDYINFFGGIIGNTCGEDGFAIFVDNCTYTGFDRGLGNENLTDVGTKQ